MELPKIQFSKWYKWSEQKSIENIDAPGMYLLAKFKDVPVGNADVLDKNIIYIGETCNRTIKRRLYEFNNSAFRSKDGHSGGWTYNETFKNKGDDLYVAALPVPNLPENIRHSFIRFVERKLILDYAVKYGSQPQLNRK